MFDPTKDNAASKKQKVDKDTKKKAAFKETKKKETKKNKKKSDDWEHDKHYMKMLKDGFPEYGSVSPCQNYYIANNNDCYK